jgi:plasmid stability protein
MVKQSKLHEAHVGQVLVVSGLENALLVQLRLAAARNGRSLDDEVASALSEHVHRLFGDPRNRSPAASRTQIGQGMSEQCHGVSPMKRGLQMLLDVSAGAEAKRLL